MEEFIENLPEGGQQTPPPETKKGKHKPKLWLSLVSLVLFVATLTGAITMWSAWGIESLSMIGTEENQRPGKVYSQWFDYDVRQIFTDVQLVALRDDADAFIQSSRYRMEMVSFFEQAENQLADEYGSTLYYAKNMETEKVYTNITDPETEKALQEYQSKDNFVTLSFVNDKVSVTFHDQNREYPREEICTDKDYNLFANPLTAYFDMPALEEYHTSTGNPAIGSSFLGYLNGGSSSYYRSLFQIEILIPQEATTLPGRIKECYNDYRENAAFSMQHALKIAGSAALSVACLIFLVIFLRNAKALFCWIGRGVRGLFRQFLRLARWCAGWMNRITLEIKLLVLLFYLFFTPLVGGAWWLLSFYTFLAGVILFFLLLSDLAVNRSELFKHNQIRAGVRRYREFEKRRRFQQRIDLRFALCCAATMVSLFIMVFGVFGGVFWVVLAGLLLLVASVIFYYVINFRSKEDTQKLIAMIEDMHNGNFQYGVWLDKESDMYVPSLWLNDIRSQVEKEVEDRIKSERMKVELITNVSHDLKTPLTSMINYIDLLQDEELSPEFANDYVQVLHKKINHLKTMVEDLFDVAKANSGNLEVVKERIELGELVEQTLGEDEAAISRAGLDIRVNNHDSKVYVETDGPKMYRIVSNIIGNAVKYAMPGTRVYIDIAVTDGTARMTVKNISNYEMNFTAEEIMERFKRGDESRTTEGSGLGLSIIQSFASLLSGEFRIEIDGDLFKATLEFPAAE